MMRRHGQRLKLPREKSLEGEGGCLSSTRACGYVCSCGKNFPEIRLQIRLASSHTLLPMHSPRFYDAFLFFWGGGVVLLTGVI